jgi:hypothetical protein
MANITKEGLILDSKRLRRALQKIVEAGDLWGSEGKQHHEAIYIARCALALTQEESSRLNTNRKMKKKIGDFMAITSYRVKIKQFRRPHLWYSDKVGQEFEVVRGVDTSRIQMHDIWMVVEEDKVICRFIFLEDAEIIDPEY